MSLSAASRRRSRARHAMPQTVADVTGPVGSDLLSRYTGREVAASGRSVGAMQMRWHDVSARRLARNHLSVPAAGCNAAAVSAATVGIHAQVMSAAELSIGLRLENCHRSDVRRALWTDRTLVKTRGPRGTVHLLAADDLPMWSGALAAVPQGSSPFAPDVRMSAEQTDLVVAAAADAAVDAELTVDELTEAIVARVGSWAGDRVMDAFQDKWPRWRQAEAAAMYRGALCFGPVRGRRSTYTSPRRWLPDFEPAPAEAALAALVERYLYAYGPATPAQFARWLGAPPTWAAQLFQALGERLERVSFDGTDAWVAAGDVTPGEEAPTVRLLPYFDAYVIACHPREALFPEPAGERALNRGQAGNVPVLLVDGVVAGVWHLRRSGRRIAVTVEPFAALTARRRADLEVQVERVGVVLEGAAGLDIGTVGTGPHA